MSVEVIDKIKPKNGGKFKIIDSVDVEMSDGSNLEETVEELTEIIDDIYKGKFEGSEFYYTREEINEAFYNREEVEDLITILENEIDEFQTLEDVKTLISTFFPIQLNQIDYDFDVYLKKADLNDRIKEIIDTLNIQGGSINIESIMEQLEEKFYKKEEVLNKEEVYNEISKAFNESSLSNVLSASFYNKDEMDTKLSDINSAFSSSIIEVNANLANHVNEANNKFSSIEETFAKNLTDGLDTKVGKSEFNDLVTNFDSHCADFQQTVTSIYDNLCDEQEVKNIINIELNDGNSLDNSITDKVNDRYRELTEFVKKFEIDMGLYAKITFVNEEISNLQSLITALGNENGIIDENGKSIFNRLEELKNDNLNLSNKLNNILGELNPEEDNYITVKVRLEKLDREVLLMIEQLEGLTDRITTIESSVSTLENNFNDDHLILSNINDVVIPAFTEDIKNLQNTSLDNTQNIENLTKAVDKINVDISETGLNEIKENIVELDTSIQTLLTKPTVNEFGELDIVENSIYDVVFSFDSMNYIDDLGLEQQFNSQEFFSDIKSNTDKIARNAKDIESNNLYTTSLATRMSAVESKQLDHTSAIGNIQGKMDSLDEYEQQYANIVNDVASIKSKVDEMDALTASSIITKINNSEETYKILSNNINLRGSISYTELSGDLTSLLTKTDKGIYINGRMVTPNTIDSNSINFKGLSITAVEKNESTVINKYETLGISDTGLVTITNPIIKTSNFSNSDIEGFILSEDKVQFNNAIVKGKFIMNNGGIDGLEENNIRMWVGVGEEEKEKAPLKILSSGHLFASDAMIGGTIIPSVLHSGNIHLENDEIKINNSFALLNNIDNNLEIHERGEQEEFICLNPRESKFNTNIKIGENIKYDISLNKLDIKSKVMIENDSKKITINEKGIAIDSHVSTHNIYKNDAGTLVNESGNNSSVSDPDFLFTSKNSVRDCSVKINGSLEVTEELRTDKNNVVMRSTENGFAFFAI